MKPNEFLAWQSKQFNIRFKISFSAKMLFDYSLPLFKLCTIEEANLLEGKIVKHEVAKLFMLLFLAEVYDKLLKVS